MCGELMGLVGLGLALAWSDLFCLVEGGLGVVLRDI